MKLTPTNPLWLAVAQQTGTRPPHCFTVYHAARERGFDAVSFAAFAMLDVKHVRAIVDALTSKGLLANTPARAPTGTASHLPSKLLPSFTVPVEWLSWAREKRFWTQADTEAEAELFVDYWVSTGKPKADWRRTWQVWVRNSRRPNGTHSPAATERTVAEQIETLERSIATYERLGRGSETGDMRRQIDKLRGDNVVRFARG